MTPGFPLNLDRNDRAWIEVNVPPLLESHAPLHVHSAAIAATGSRGWSPVAVWIMVFPLMIPAPNGRAVVATLVTAAMDPLGLWVSKAAHASWSDLGSTFLPTLLAALIAPIAARTVYGLTVEVGRARRLGSYRLVEKLGEGGMGEVWRARHRMLARSAAIKLIRTSVLGDPSGPWRP